MSVETAIFSPVVKCDISVAKSLDTSDCTVQLRLLLHDSLRCVRGTSMHQRLHSAASTASSRQFVVHSLWCVRGTSMHQRLHSAAATASSRQFEVRPRYKHVPATAQCSFDCFFTTVCGASEVQACISDCTVQLRLLLHDSLWCVRGTSMHQLVLCFAHFCRHQTHCAQCRCNDKIVVVVTCI